jgi:hypothetical protein
VRIEYIAEIQERISLFKSTPTVQLSHSRNKYVLVQVQDDENTAQSASAKECGGPYHSNVAEELMECIEAAAYDNAVITGGGRFNNIQDSATAHMYGFSYGFGKGDQAESGIMATYDNSNALY